MRCIYTRYFPLPYSNLSPMLNLSLGLKKVFAYDQNTRTTSERSQPQEVHCSVCLPSHSFHQPGWQRISQPYQHINPSPLPHSHPCPLDPTFLNAHYQDNKHIKHAFSITTTCDNEGQMLIKGGKGVKASKVRGA